MTKNLEQRAQARRFSRESQLSLLMRVATLGCQFLLVMALAASLPANDFALFGLLQSLVVVLVRLAGGEYFQPLSRRLMERAGRGFDPKIVAHLRLLYASISVNHLFLLTVAAGLVAIGVFPATLAFFVMAVTLSDHLILEANRCLVALQRPFAANALILARTVSWAVPIVAVIAVQSSVLELRTLLLAWLLGGCLAVIFASFLLKHAPLKALRSFHPSLKRARKHYRRHWRFVVTAACGIALFHFDRLLVVWFATAEEAAAYIFFAAMTASIYAAAEAGALQPALPRLIAAAGQNKLREALITTLFRSSLLASGCALALSVILSVIVFEVDRYNSYHEYLYLLWLLSLVQVVRIFGDTMQNGLYALRADQLMMISGVAGLLAMIVLATIGQTFAGIIAVAVAALLPGVIKSILPWRLLRSSMGPV